MSPDPASALSRIATWSARRRWALDAFVVAAIVGLGTLRAPDDVQELTGWLFTVGLAVPLFWRRQHPVAVFAAVAAVALVQWALGVKAFGDAALLVALYTVAARTPLRTTLAAVAVLELGAALAVVRWAPDGHPLDGFVALTGLTTAATLLGLNVRHRQALVASLEERAARLEAERDQQRHLAAAAERARIAREMHDIVAHNLSVMIALSDGAGYAVDDEPDRARAAMGDSARVGREALAEMRRLLGVLRNDDPASDGLAPQPGIGQLDALADQVRAAGVPTTITVTGAPAGDVPGGLQLAVYRIVQEALTNVLKHAGAGVAASVDVRWDGPLLRVEIADTGNARRPASAGEGGGLRGMRERAAVFDGSVVAGPRPSGGWAVVAELVHHAAPVLATEAHA